MRTTIEFPDELYRQLKARAALEGRPVKALLNALLVQALTAAESEPDTPRRRSSPPVISTGQALAIGSASNAGLFELLDDLR